MNNEVFDAVRVAVFTENRFLYQKIKLELGDDALCAMCSDNTAPDAEVYLIDADCERFKYKNGLTMSYSNKNADIALPFKIGTMRDLILRKGKCIIKVDSENGFVQLGGKTITLTDVEMALFEAIYSRAGEFASRDALLKEVWDGACDSGIINVYVHYLREKLESDGEKIIICSRKCGYAISKKYIGDSKDA